MPGAEIPIGLSDLARELLGRACAVAKHQSQRELRQLPEVQAILTADAEVRRECVLALAWGLLLPYAYPEHPWTQHQNHLLALVARKPAPLTVADLEWVVRRAEDVGRWEVTPEMTMTALIAQFRAFYEREPGEEAAALIARAAELCHYKADIDRMTAIVARAPAADPWAAIDGRDHVGPRIRAALEREPRGTDVLALLRAFPAGGRASQRWLADADALGVRDAAALVDAVLGADDVDLDTPHRRVVFVTGDNEALACALVAFAGAVAGDALIKELRRLAAKAITGPHGWERSLKLANACVRAIARTASTEAVRELTALERSTTHGTLKREIDTAIEQIAAAQGVDRARLLETVVETHGLDRDGVVAVAGARIALENLKVRTSSGLPDEARERAKALRATLAAERARLDGLLGLDRTWSRKDWQRLYLDHPVTGHLARRLIWRFGDHVDLGANAPRSGRVKLWHPLDATRDELLAWRSRLLTELVVQPFRQAFRETYLITPAEERTRTHSDRFAGHVFRQTQARALMKRRGWQPVPAAWWDDGIEHGVARRVYEHADVRAEFFFDPIEDIDPDPSGVYRYCTSDQVRFFRGRTDEALPLTDVPPVVFSEALRDVDLFVSVTSIGADPDWHTRAEGRRFARYWNEVNLGELNAIGELRRDLLAELLPRLPIAPQAELEDPNLVVRGPRHTYRIHLGSGQIRISPDQRRFELKGSAGRRAAQLYLPIDDDPILTGILAAALTLAKSG